MPGKKRNKKRNFFGVWRKCHGDPARILERIGATMYDFWQWMKDPAFAKRFEEASRTYLPSHPDTLLFLAKELPLFKWHDPVYAFAKHAAALPEKERTAFLQCIAPPAFRKRVESKLKQCLSGRFKPGFYSEKDRQIAELICDQSLTDEKRATKAGMTLRAFIVRKSAWMKNIAALGVHQKSGKAH